MGRRSAITGFGCLQPSSSYIWTCIFVALAIQIVLLNVMQKGGFEQDRETFDTRRASNLTMLPIGSQTFPEKSNTSKLVLAWISPAFRQGAISTEVWFSNGTQRLQVGADPTTLHRERQRFLDQRNESSEASYWMLLKRYHFHIPFREGIHPYFSGMIPTSDSICGFGPGHGLEEEGGFKLLTQKIKIDSNSEGNPDPIRLFCAVYTHDKMRFLTRVMALSWAHKCDGFLAFSTEDIPSLGIMRLEHEGPESYSNMWQKVRSIWAFIHAHFADHFDFFHLCGDDTYVIVENMRRFLAPFLATNKNDEPLHLGQWIRQKNHPYVSGGPGYTVNRVALDRFSREAIVSCHVATQAYYEDRLFSSCMNLIGVQPEDSRDVRTGEQLFHSASPHTLYTTRVVSGRRASFQSRAMSYWATLPHPNGNKNGNKSVGMKYGLSSAGKYSVSFHNLYNPLYAARVHAILYPETCPHDSPLRIGMEFYKAINNS